MNSAETLTTEDTQRNKIVLDDVTDKQIDSAVDGFIQVAAGAHPAVVREPGLFLVNPDLKKVRTFIHAAGALPVTRPEVLAYLGYSEGFIKGLEPKDFIELYAEIHNIVEIWETAETLMKETGATFITFHTELKSLSQDILAHSLMQADNLYEGQVGDVTDLETRFGGKPLGEGELRKLPALIELAKELVTVVGGHEQKAARVKGVLKAFRKSLRDAKDDVQRMRAQAADNDGREMIRVLDESLNMLDQRIEERGKTYDTYAEYTWVGAWWGPLGLAISYSIYSGKASAVKSEYNSLIESKNELKNKISNLEKGMASLLNIQADLQGLELLASEALNGAANIENIWAIIGQHITDSVERLKNTTTTTQLFLFKSRLSTMLEHWAEISKHASALLENIAHHD